MVPHPARPPPARGRPRWAGPVTAWPYPGGVSLESRAARLVADYGGTDALSITELYKQVDRALRSSFPEEIWITGEIRSLKVLTRGHCFLDLVDPTHARDSGAPTLNVKCWSIRWRSVRSTLDRLGITLDAGMVVRVRGEVQFYKTRGTVDFILSDLDTDALLGKVAAERARVIKALVDEDLFDRQRRLPPPTLPLRVGLVASPGTEGFNDFLGGLHNSGMAFAVTVAPTAVQGKAAPVKMAAALSDLQAESLDLIVIVRGGGSKADLAAFDQEALARAIATSTVPVWTGIGHTGDQSVADEVANRSFITPTECGQELARLASEFWRGVQDARRALSRMAFDQVEAAGRLQAARQRAVAIGARSPLGRHADSLGHRARTLRSVSRGQLDTHGLRLDSRGQILVGAARRRMDAEGRALGRRSERLALLPQRQLVGEQQRVSQWRRLLGAYDYRRQLERGYSVTRDESGRVVRSVSAVDAGSLLRTRLADGELVSTVGDNDSSAPTVAPAADTNQAEGTQ
jgi:exodeoxyribonuclease VII large subunit